MSEADYSIRSNLGDGMPYAGTISYRPEYDPNIGHEWFSVVVIGNRTARELGSVLTVAIADDTYYFVKKNKGVGTIRKDQCKRVDK